MHAVEMKSTVAWSRYQKLTIWRLHFLTTKTAKTLLLEARNSASIIETHESNGIERGIFRETSGWSYHLDGFRHEKSHSQGLEDNDVPLQPIGNGTTNADKTMVWWPQEFELDATVSLLVLRVLNNGFQTFHLFQDFMSTVTTEHDNLAPAPPGIGSHSLNNGRAPTIRNDPWDNLRLPFGFRAETRDSRGTSGNYQPREEPNMRSDSLMRVNPIDQPPCWMRTEVHWTLFVCFSYSLMRCTSVHRQFLHENGSTLGNICHTQIYGDLFTL